MPAPVVAAAVARSGAAKAGAASTGATSQRAAISKIKAARPTPSAPAATPPKAPAVRSEVNSRPALPGALTDQRGAPAAFRRFRDPVRAANTGGGFVLGLGLYGLGLTYLRGGKPAVMALVRAKFLNQVQP